jgi:Ran GTPase-activating protein (RanGAP) involved in mRNA processing and transport
MVFQLDLSNNQLCGLSYYGSGTYTAEGITAIADALRVNGGLTSLNLSSNQLCGLDRHGRGTYTAEGITGIADALRVNGALTKLSLAQNKLEVEGTKAICEALEQNTTLKELDISGGYEGNIGGSAGAKHVAKMLGVNRALTVTNLLGNQLDAESAKMLAEVAKQKGISLCGIRRDQTTADFRNKYLEPADAILLASDLSQAVVTGGLTSLNLSENQLCGLYKNGGGTYTAQGITAIADALRVNGALTQVLAF